MTSDDHDPWYRICYLIGYAIGVILAILIGTPVLMIHIINANR